MLSVSTTGWGIWSDSWVWLTMVQDVPPNCPTPQPILQISPGRGWHSQNQSQPSHTAGPYAPPCTHDPNSHVNPRPQETTEYQRNSCCNHTREHWRQNLFLTKLHILWPSNFAELHQVKSTSADGASTDLYLRGDENRLPSSLPSSVPSFRRFTMALNGGMTLLDGRVGRKGHITDTKVSAEW